MANKHPNTSGLKSFKKGDIGNPTGKKFCSRESVMLRSISIEDLIKIAKAQAKKAIADGDTRAADFVYQQVWGKIAENLNVKNTQPIQIMIDKDDANL